MYLTLGYDLDLILEKNTSGKKGKWDESQKWVTP